MNLFEKAFKGQESVLVKRIDPDHGLLRALKDECVLTDEQINDCTARVCYY